MKVTSIELYTGDIEVAKFELNNVSSTSPYLVKAILGLDAEQIISKFYGFGTSGITKLYDYVMPPRQIVIQLKLNPNRLNDVSVSELRDYLYRAVAQSRTGVLELRFFNGPEYTAYVQGFITKIEAPLFSKSPLVNITLNCDDPILKAPNSILLEYSTHVVDNNPVIIGNDISTAPHGFIMEVTCLVANTDFFVITDYTDSSAGPDWEFNVRCGYIWNVYGFQVGDKIHMNSMANQKELWVVRNEVKLFIGDHIGLNSIWPMMFPGLNKIRFRDPTLFDLSYIEYTPVYWGV